MALTTWGSRQERTAYQTADDYIVETEAQGERPRVALQAVRLLQLVLIAVIAVLSFAVFWIVATMLGLV